MLLKNASMCEILNLSKTRNLYCFGSGMVLEELCKKYDDLSGCIKGILDNDIYKSNTIKIIQNNEIPIYSVNQFLEKRTNADFILITSIYYVEILEQLDKIKILDNMECYIYILSHKINENKQTQLYKEEKVKKTEGHFRIPKIIHYCWLSEEPYPELIKKCMNSWLTLMPEYKIIKWDTNNFDVNICSYTAEAYKEKKYAFVSDYVRLYALYHYGGIYLDSDIEVFKSFNKFLYHDAFTGFEDDQHIAAWLFGSKPNNPLFKELLEYYDRKHFKIHGNLDLTPNVVPVTDTLKKYGLEFINQYQELKNIVVYPSEYFCPKNYNTGEIDITPNTHSIHYFNAGWMPEDKRNLHIKNIEEIPKLLFRIERGN